MSSPLKFGFVHIPKAAGCSFTTVARAYICQPTGLQNRNGFHAFDPVRDYTPDELRRLLESPDRMLIHQHAQNWPTWAICRMKVNGWPTFAFYRPIRQRLLSFWTWSQMKLRKYGRNPMAGEITQCVDPERFLRTLLCMDRYHTAIALPDWYELIDKWYPANTLGIVRCARDVFEVNLGSDFPTENVSDTKLEWGDLTDELRELINNDPRIKSWDNFGQLIGYDHAAE